MIKISKDISQKVEVQKTLLPTSLFRFLTKKNYDSTIL